MSRKRDKLKRVIKAIRNKADTDDIFILSSSVAYHSFLSFIPIISVLVGIYLILNFNLDWGHFSLIKELVPPDMYKLVEGQAQRINENLNTINIATAFSFLISLWLANNVTRTLAHSLNIVFCRKDQKHFLFSLGESILYTLVLVSSFMFLGFMLTVLPLIFSFFDPSQRWEFLFILFQWSVVSLYMVFGLCFVYKYLPAHGKKIGWNKFLPGAVVATVFGSLLALMFSFYVSNFGAFNKVYGALGVIIVMLLWLRLTFASVLFGGEVNFFLLEDPSLRSYYRVKMLFSEYREEGKQRIHWIRVFLAVVFIVVLSARIYFPVQLDKNLAKKIEDSELNITYDDVDIQTFLADLQIEDLRLEVNNSVLNFKTFKNDIGWLSLGVRNRRSNVQYRGGVAVLDHSDAYELAQALNKFTEVVAYGGVEDLVINDLVVKLLHPDRTERIVVKKIVHSVTNGDIEIVGSSPKLIIRGRRVPSERKYEVSITRNNIVNAFTCEGASCTSAILQELTQRRAKLEQ
ncbi:MAG: hypothetical protein CME64_16760 [Halobacteriovoraceae bacterium]|nr:hypothetical protein [Halobacteriovoraceae bacterium]|tara:strand:+ start:179141 stop:180691 length:1551 start_codon:yes stop_codon:yes gene_type:complete